MHTRESLEPGASINLRCKSSGPALQTKCMDKVIRKYTNRDALQADQ
jgi:hypothetical protein